MQIKVFCNKYNWDNLLFLKKLSLNGLIQSSVDETKKSIKLDKQSPEKDIPEWLFIL